MKSSGVAKVEQSINNMLKRRKEKKKGGSVYGGRGFKKKKAFTFSAICCCGFYSSMSGLSYKLSFCVFVGLCRTGRSVLEPRD